MVASRELGILVAAVSALVAGCGGRQATADGAVAEDRSNGGDVGVDVPAPVDAACVATDGQMADSVHGFVDLDVVGRGFEPYEGKTAWFLTRRTMTHVIFGIAQTTIAGGQVALHFPDGFERQAYQEVFWFVDANGDGLCNEDAGDHVGYTITNGFNPVGSEPYVLMFEDDETVHRPPIGGETVCEVMNQCG